MQIRRIVAGAVVFAMVAPAIPLDAGDRIVRCESGRFGRYRECRVPTEGRVQLVREYSNHRCRLWKTWGYDRHSVWVDEGCRGEFRVGRDDRGGGGGAAAVIGVLAGAAILAAILANRDDDRPDQAAYAPDWMRGEFRGFSPKEDVQFEIQVERDGRVHGTANDQRVAGYTTSDQRLMLGRLTFRTEREPWGFSAIEERDPEHVIYFRHRD